MVLKVENLYVSVDNKQILKGISLDVKSGEVHLLMGPNGSGKSTLAYTISGHPKCKVTDGKIYLDDKNLLDLKPHERAKAGIFLGFQHPIEVEGITVSHFLYQIAKRKDNIDPVSFRKELLEKIKLIGVDESFLNRQLNVGFSGGERKKLEILQLLIIKPKIAILDEPDSGVDFDSLKRIADMLEFVVKKEKIGILLITHHNKILEKINPDKVYVIKEGEIVNSGDIKLAQTIEARGYKEI